MVKKTSLFSTIFHTLNKWFHLNDLYHQSTQNSEASVLWATVVFCFVSALMPSNKLFFVVAVFYFLGVFFLTQSIKKTLLYTFVPLYLITVGQLYILNVIQPQELHKDSGYDGRQFFFRFTPHSILLIVSTILLVIEVIRKRGNVKFGLEHLVFFSIFIASFYSVLQAQYFPLFAFATVVRGAATIAWMMLQQQFLADQKEKQKIHILKTFFLIVLLMMTLQAGLTIGQFVKRSTLGLKIEQTTTIPRFGAGADENALRFRPVGLNTHANNLAANTNEIFMVGIIVYAWLIRKKENVPWWLITFFVSETLLILMLTQSRAAYLGLGIAALIFFMRQKKLCISTFKFLKEKLRPLIIFFLSAVIIIVPIVAERLVYSLNSFSGSGGFATRQTLEKDALYLISQYPAFGVGPEMYIPAAFNSKTVSLAFTYFPESVHNGFLLYMVEYGLIAFTLQSVLFYLLIRKTLLLNLSDLLKSCLLAGYSSTYIIIFFHPFSDLTNLFILFSWILVYIQQQEKHAST
jgi:hypothetical protein